MIKDRYRQEAAVSAGLQPAESCRAMAVRRIAGRHVFKRPLRETGLPRLKMRLPTLTPELWTFFTTVAVIRPSTGIICRSPHPSAQNAQQLSVSLKDKSQSTFRERKDKTRTGKKSSFPKHMSSQGLVPKTYREVLKLNNKKTDGPVKK